MIDVVEIRPHLGAQPAARDGIVGIAAEAHGAAVLDLGDDAAGVGAVVRTGAANVKVWSSLEPPGGRNVSDWFDSHL